MSSETIKLTVKFKLKETPEGLDDLFTTYREIVNFLITYAFESNITSFYRLKKETYKSLREKYSKLPSHYIYTACQMATSISKSYRKRKIQKKLRTGKKRKMLLEKYGERERNRLNDLYHKLAIKIVELAEKYGGIALEDLTKIRDSIRYSAEMNGRLHRWSFRRLQSIIEYKAKLEGIKVIFVDPKHTSSLCPICGVKLSPNGHRILKCKNCGLTEDRDVIGSWNIRLKALKMWGVSVPPESPPMKALARGGKPARYEINAFRVING